jgi:hypothetical protein
MLFGDPNDPECTPEIATGDVSCSQMGSIVSETSGTSPQFAWELARGSASVTSLAGTESTSVGTVYKHNLVDNCYDGTDGPKKGDMEVGINVPTVMHDAIANVKQFTLIDLCWTFNAGAGANVSCFSGGNGYMTDAWVDEGDDSTDYPPRIISPAVGYKFQLCSTSLQQ